MKNVFLLLAFLLTATVLPAQYSPVRESDRQMSFGNRPCFRLEFRDADKGLVEDEWKIFAKERFNAKLKKDKKSNELYAADVKTSYISPNAFTIRSTVEKNGEDVALNIWFDLGSTFLNRRDAPQQTGEAVRMLEELYVEVRRELINLELKEAENKMKDLEKVKKQLEKENKGHHDDIESYKAKIKKAEDDIVKNEQSQNSNVADQEAQRRMIDEIKLRLQNVGNERN
jgi:hypothetical protein